MSKALTRDMERYLIEKYVGIPYLHKGRDRRGMDCYGLVLAVSEELGRNLLDFNIDYEEKWYLRDHNLVIENYHHQWNRVTDHAPGDLVFFTTRYFSQDTTPRITVNHVGVAFSGRRFIHACRAGVVISSLNDIRWQQRVEGFYRFKETADDNN